MAAALPAHGGGLAPIEANIQTSLSPGEIAANAFLLPLALAFSLPHYGFERYPYDAGAGYGQGHREWSGTFWVAGQALAGERAGGHATLQLRGANRLGWDASWTGFTTGALRSGTRGDLVAGHITSNYLQSGRALFELGLGLAAFRDDRSRSGPSAALALEWFPRSPWTAAVRYEATLLAGQGFHAAAARLGITCRGVGLFGGIRAFLGPSGNPIGPEAGISAWF